jgi:hypothetical protein
MNGQHFQRKKQGLFKEMVLLAKCGITVFFETGVTLFSFNEEMVTPSNIDKNWVLKGVLLL